jgi:DNA-binding transcriptional regulator LsrR (DeoR family)
VAYVQPASRLRLVTRVARMYHEQGLKQPQIAELLHVSQAKVSRLLKRAEELGIVRVVIVPPPGGHSELEEALVARYGLLDAVVADAPSGDEKAITSAVGAAAASYLEDVLLSHERIGISSWSETLLAMVNVLGKRPQPVADSVTQVIGGVGIPEAQVQATRLTERLAVLTGGQPSFLPTPGVVSGSALRDAMLAEPYVTHVVEEWSRLTVLLAGIGSLDPSPLLRRSGNAIAESEQDVLRGLGAVGDICLRFFDADGGQIQSDLDSRVVGIDAEALLAVPRRIGVAGGPRKHSAIRAAVLGGWVNVLVTDVDTAEALLA